MVGLQKLKQNQLNKDGVSMKTIVVNTTKCYEVLIGSELLDQCGKLTVAVKAPCKVVLVSDDNVYPIYGEQVKHSYQSAGFEVSTFVFPSGEKNKSFETLVPLVEFAAEKGLSRSDLIVALGGGVVGDLAGFAASMYLRGVDFVQVPTTFLAAIDSSVGGKTGVDLNSGKNQVGAFHQPILVICDTDSFKTLSPQIFSDGICEAIKYGVICDKELFATLTASDIHANINEIVERCVAIKRDIVCRDEFDCGERMLLNLGHTVGHAIEKLSNYEITHGNAVAIGMLYIARACFRAGIAVEDYSIDIKYIMDKYNISGECNYSVHDLSVAAMSDKKRSAGTISLVLIEGIGKSFLKQIPVAELEAFIGLGGTTANGY